MCVFVCNKRADEWTNERTKERKNWPAMFTWRLQLRYFISLARLLASFFSLRFSNMSLVCCSSAGSCICVHQCVCVCVFDQVSEKKALERRASKDSWEWGWFFMDLQPGSHQLLAARQNRRLAFSLVRLKCLPVSCCCCCWNICSSMRESSSSSSRSSCCEQQLANICSAHTQKPAEKKEREKKIEKQLVCCSKKHSRWGAETWTRSSRDSRVTNKSKSKSNRWKSALAEKTKRKNSRCFRRKSVCVCFFLLFCFVYTALPVFSFYSPLTWLSAQKGKEMKRVTEERTNEVRLLEQVY